MSNSEVARLRQELETSANAAWLGLYGLASVGKHITITKHMENMAQSIQALAGIVGEEQAMQVWIEIGNQQEAEQIGNQPHEPEQHDMSPSQ